MTKKVLITGINGFLGSALCEYFKAQRSAFQVFGIDREAPLSSKCIFLCDLNDQKEVLKIISRLRPDYIFHLTGGRRDNDNDLLRNNVLATKILLETVSDIKDYSPRVIIPGSAAEYGKAVSVAPIKETILPQPASFYGFVKNMQTNLGLMYARAGLDVVIARIFNVCGYGMPPTLSLGKFSKQIALIEKNKKRQVIRTGSLGARRDFLDIKDVCSAFLAIARRAKSGEVYNVCSGNPYLMRDLLKELINCAQGDHLVIQEDKGGMRGVDVSVGANAKIKRSVGWKPKVNISQSLRDTLDYYRERVSVK